LASISTALFDIATVIASTVASETFVLFARRGDYIAVMLAAAVVTLFGAGAIVARKIVINRSWKSDQTLGHGHLAPEGPR
jgi:hypothetical protein